MQMYEIQIGERLIGVPWWWFDALLGWMGLMGLVLWLCGKPLIKPTAAFTGLLIGAIAGAVAVSSLTADMPPLPFAIGAAMILGFFGWLAWRLWLGFGLGAILVVTTVAVVIMASGLTLDPLPTKTGEAINEVRLAYGFDVTVTNGDTSQPVENDDTTTDPDTPDKSDTPQTGTNGPDGDTGEPGAGGYEPPKWSVLKPKVMTPLEDGFDQWWEATTSGQVATLLIASSAVAMLGLIIGIMLPNFSGPLVIAAVGVDLMSVGVLRLLAAFAPSLYDTILGSGVYLVFGALAVTLFGATVQWVIYRKKTKNKED